MAGADAIMMRRHPVSAQPRVRAAEHQPRPSPFKHPALEVEVTQRLPASVVAARAPVTEAAAPEPVAFTEPPREKESRLGRFLSKIPLLRHLRRHLPTDESQPN